MPYMLSESKLCVHKKNSDGTQGEKIKCHGSKEKALAHLRALEINVDDALKAKVPGYKAITDAPELRGSSQHHCGNCNFYKYMESYGYGEDSSEHGICNKHAFLTNYDWVCDNWVEFSFEDSMNAAAKFGAVKVSGDWELSVNGNPFSVDSDSQWFDANTKLVTGTDIPVVYYHSIEKVDSKTGKVFFDQVPIVIGKASNPQKKQDGIWWKVILDKTVQKAQEVWDAAVKGLAVASSGAIDYLSRLDIGGKLVPYEKSIPGRIAVWHMGELSLWPSDGNHVRQANPHAIAVPALKAIYEAAHMPLPPSIVSPKNSETDKVRKGELEELRKFTENIEKYIENF